jgi:hypothetical protein
MHLSVLNGKFCCFWSCVQKFLTPTKYIPYISRVPQCLSPRRNWDPHPLTRKRVWALWGWGGPNSDDWRKSLVLRLLCAPSHYSWCLLRRTFPAYRSCVVICSSCHELKVTGPGHPILAEEVLTGMNWSLLRIIYNAHKHPRITLSAV